MRAERFALDERHRVEREPVRLAGGEHRDDVRLLEAGDRSDLALEPLGAQPLRQVRRQHFYHDLSLEPHLFGDEDAAHAAAPELALQSIRVAERLLQLGRQRALMSCAGGLAGGDWRCNGGGTRKHCSSAAEL